MIRRLVISLILFLAPFGALAQTTVKQSGTVTVGHVPVWTTNGTISDPTASTGSTLLNSVPIVKLGGTPLTVSNYGPTNGAGYNYWGLGVSASLGILSLSPVSPAAAIPAAITVNGNTAIAISTTGAVTFPSGATSPAGGTSGQVQYNNSGSLGGFTVSGDGTLNTSTGALVVTKTNGTAFGTAATANLGTSGAFVPLLNTANTWSATQAFPNGSTFGGFAVSIAGPHTLSGAYASTFTFTGITSVTFPTSGTLDILGASTFTGTKTFADGSTFSSTGLNLATPLLAGSPGYTTSGVNAAQFTGNTNNFYQVSIQNTNSGTSASSDYVVTANDGTDSTHYADFGMNNSAGAATPFTNAHAAYLYSTDAELDLGALGTSGAIGFYIGGGTSSPTSVGSVTATGLNGMAVGATTRSTGAFTSLAANSGLTVSAGSVSLPAGSIVNGALANSATTVNGQTCTLGATCTVTAAATGITIGTTTISGGNSGYIEYNNAGVLGELATTGSGNVVRATSPALTTPALGVATGTSLALNGATIGSNALAVTGTATISGQLTSTVASGTAPFVVSSATVVGNLNASYLNGNTFASPGPIGTGTASSGAFTNLTITNPLSPAYGGTGVANNSASTLTISGAYGTTFTVSGATSLTLPTTGTLAILGANTFTGTQTFADGATWGSTGLSDTASYSTASTSIFNVAPTWTFSSISNGISPIAFGGTMAPAGASAGNTSYFTISPVYNTAVTAGVWRGLNVSATVSASTSATIGQLTAAQFAVTNSSSTPATTAQNVALVGVANGSGLTSGSITNTNLQINANTAVAGTGGTVTNYGINLALASGTNTGTSTNYGLYISGNGQTGGTTTNYAIYSSSTATSYFAGAITTSSALGVSSTSSLGTGSTNYVTVAGSSVNPIINTSGGALQLSASTNIVSIYGSNSSGQVVGLISNGASGSGAGAQLKHSTGTTNSLATLSLFDNNAAPYMAWVLGSAVGQVYFDLANPLSFRNTSGAEQVRITNTASASNYLTLTGSNGGAPTIGTSGGALALTSNIGYILATAASAPAIIFNDTGRGTDLKNWIVGDDGASNFQIKAFNDSLTAVTSAYIIARGTTYNVASHTWYTSTSAGSQLTGMVLNSTNLTITPGGLAQGITLTASASSGATVSTNAGNLILSSTGGTTTESDATHIFGTGAVTLKQVASATLTIGVNSSSTTALADPTITMPNISNATTAQTGTLCWKSTGITYDNTNTCLLSSLRFKQDIATVTNGLAVVTALRPVAFKYKATPSEQHYGLIAEEVVKVDPGLVILDQEQKPLKVKYIDSIAYLIGAVQELKADNDNLRREIAALKRN